MLFGFVRKFAPVLESFGLNKILIDACRCNNEIEMKILLKMGADANVRNEDGESVLQIVYNNDNIDMLKYLLNHGANVNMQYNTGATLLFEACRKNDFALVQYLVQEIEFVAIKKSDCELIARLVKKTKDLNDVVNKSNLDIKNIEGNTPLFMAIRNGNKEMVEYLLEHGASIGARNYNGETPIIYSVKLGREEMVDFLTDRYSGLINKRDFSGKTPLIHACIGGNANIINILFKKGAFLNIMDKSKRTAITYICEDYNYNIAKILIDKYQEIIEEARLKDNLEAEEVVNCELKRAAFFSVDNGNMRMLKQVLELGYENSQDCNGATLLMHAIKNKQTNIALFLLGQFVDITIRDKDGLTALMYSIKYKQTQVFLYLIEKGVDIDDYDNDGITPLMYAVYANEKNMIGLLIKKGVHVNSVNYFGETALMIAYKQGFNEICDLLEKSGAKNSLVGFRKNKALAEEKYIFNSASDRIPLRNFFLLDDKDMVSFNV